MGKAVVLGGRHYPTKKEAIVAARALLHSLPLGPLPPEHVPFVTDLLRDHPEREEKQGSGIDHFEIRSNRDFRHNNEFWIVRTDGSAVCFSYNGGLAPKSVRNTVVSAFRIEITPDILAFVRDTFKPGMLCPITGAPLVMGEIDVDHEAPPFASILDWFLDSRILDIEKIRWTSEPHRACTGLADRGLAADWRMFHGERANLRLLSHAGHKLVTHGKAK